MMNQKDYLKKYLSVNKDKKKSKKKKKHDIGNLKIIDDAVLAEDNETNYEYDEDAPTIAEVTYETDSSGKMSTLSKKTNASVSSDIKKLIKDSNIKQEGASKGMSVMQRRKLMKSKKITPEEIARNEREAVLQSVVNEKHDQWNRGVKQAETIKQKIYEDSYEASKEFARHAHDADLNARLKSAPREEDPMLAYVNRNKSKNVTSVMPTYKGSYPPNRYNIKPGYRWDGVDRSSGYEKSWFERMNARKAMEEDMYKWSVEDM